MVGPIVSTRKYQGQILRGRLRNIMAKDGPRWRKTCYQCIRGFYSDNVQSFDSISSSSSDAIELDMAMVFVYLQVIHRSPSNSNIGTEVYFLADNFSKRLSLQKILKHLWIVKNANSNVDL
nr:uncharacterized protein LOC117277243 isoform X4 [Nicotiana tomentosiformis]